MKRVERMRPGMKRGSSAVGEGAADAMTAGPSPCLRARFRGPVWPACGLVTARRCKVRSREGLDGDVGEDAAPVGDESPWPEADDASNSNDCMLGGGACSFTP